ncbi:Hypothetical Protein FCC1311_084782 [Hondaea fermentalgiana]|uniref:PH domain-containing protein n=1 Tax=Hondaea fermentalgiana TaxID=2315210 RepID=A0A2R5GUC0_9STRA|nr:Hypothetical Protein FCC1311_084782 [Hondaea fermentalgiana]|eukprot:GBG32253.1 Hypothetical Protein FCC1311_084782 [Hondaea fermentalgiana]
MDINFMTRVLQERATCSAGETRKSTQRENAAASAQDGPLDFDDEEKVYISPPSSAATVGGGFAAGSPRSALGSPAGARSPTSWIDGGKEEQGVELCTAHNPQTGQWTPSIVSVQKRAIAFYEVGQLRQDASLAGAQVSLPTGNSAASALKTLQKQSPSQTFLGMELRLPALNNSKILLAARSERERRSWMENISFASAFDASRGDNHDFEAAGVPVCLVQGFLFKRSVATGALFGVSPRWKRRFCRIVYDAARQLWSLQYHTAAQAQVLVPFKNIARLEEQSIEDAGATALQAETAEQMAAVTISLRSMTGRSLVDRFLIPRSTLSSFFDWVPLPVETRFLDNDAGDSLAHFANEHPPSEDDIASDAAGQPKIASPRRPFAEDEDETTPCEVDSEFEMGTDLGTVDEESRSDLGSDAEGDNCEDINAERLHHEGSEEGSSDDDDEDEYEEDDEDEDEEDEEEDEEVTSEDCERNPIMESSSTMYPVRETNTLGSKWPLEAVERVAIGGSSGRSPKYVDFQEMQGEAQDPIYNRDAAHQAHHNSDVSEYNVASRQAAQYAPQARNSATSEIDNHDNLESQAWQTVANASKLVREGMSGAIDAHVLEKCRYLLAAIHEAMIDIKTGSFVDPADTESQALGLELVMETARCIIAISEVGVRHSTSQVLETVDRVSMCDLERCSASAMRTARMLFELGKTCMDALAQSMDVQGAEHSRRSSLISAMEDWKTCRSGDDRASHRQSMSEDEVSAIESTPQVHKFEASTSVNAFSVMERESTGDNDEGYMSENFSDCEGDATGIAESQAVTGQKSPTSTTATTTTTIGDIIASSQRCIALERLTEQVAEDLLGRGHVILHKVPDTPISTGEELGEFGMGYLVPVPTRAPPLSPTSSKESQCENISNNKFAFGSRISRPIFETALCGAKLEALGRAPLFNGTDRVTRMYQISITSRRDGWAGLAFSSDIVMRKWLAVLDYVSRRQATNFTMNDEVNDHLQRRDYGLSRVRKRLEPGLRRLEAGRRYRGAATPRIRPSERPIHTVYADAGHEIDSEIGTEDAYTEASTEDVESSTMESEIFSARSSSFSSIGAKSQDLHQISIKNRKMTRDAERAVNIMQQGSTWHYVHRKPSRPIGLAEATLRLAKDCSFLELKTKGRTETATRVDILEVTRVARGVPSATLLNAAVSACKCFRENEEDEPGESLISRMPLSDVKISATDAMLANETVNCSLEQIVENLNHF